MGYSILLIVTLSSGSTFYAVGDTIFDGKEYCEYRAERAAENVIRDSDGKVYEITHGCARVFDL